MWYPGLDDLLIVVVLYRFFKFCQCLLLFDIGIKLTRIEWGYMCNRLFTGLFQYLHGFLQARIVDLAKFSEERRLIGIDKILFAEQKIGVQQLSLCITMCVAMP